MADDVPTLDSFLSWLQATGEHAQAHIDFEGHLARLVHEGHLDQVVPVLRQVAGPSTFHRVVVRAWRRAWQDARPAQAEAWMVAGLDGLPAPARRALRARLTPAEALHALSVNVCLCPVGAEGWGDAFRHWAQTTPNAQTLVNRPGDFSSTLLWYLRHHPTLLAEVRRSGVGLDLELPIQRFFGPRAGYATGVPPEFGRRQAQLQGPFWTLLGVAVERAKGLSSDVGLWANTAVHLIHLGASLDAPAWSNPRETVGDDLFRWASERTPQPPQRRWDDQQVQDLIVLGRQAPLVWDVAKASGGAGEHVRVRSRL